MTQEKTCPSCGKNVKAAALICRFCRYSFEQSQSSSPPFSVHEPNHSQSNRRFKKWWVLTTVLAFAIGGVIAYVATSGDDVTTNGSSTGSSAVSPNESSALRSSGVEATAPPEDIACTQHTDGTETCHHLGTAIAQQLGVPFDGWGPEELQFGPPSPFNVCLSLVAYRLDVAFSGGSVELPNKAPEDSILNGMVQLYSRQSWPDAADSAAADLIERCRSV